MFFEPSSEPEERLPDFKVPAAHLGHHILPVRQREPLAAMLQRENVQGIPQLLP